ncbi:uncharacterized protein GGS22DRAFT_192460 [Annulohypoxylon maeteangense]|uniref:uncharacterized protein n=1 Tax=Annulohypoxylon maeteangense TaxID=1927788 RepID=UPI0020073CA7|nr:uncharacterized protein GGS22DRAFT_192460 [Annulohypoxylon maeteangense]KAI0881371.1 hypothetical protein GGS22DRAFT_192460 [Annulohypoxylon maeteangense]
MDSSAASLIHKANGKQMYTSKYFPPSNIIYSSQGDDAHNMGFLVGFAEAQVKLRIHEGVLLIRLWSDAYDALDAKQESVIYQQYLMLVRKIAGRMIGEQLDPGKARNRPLILRKTSSVTSKVNYDEGARTEASTQAPKILTHNLSTATPPQRSTSLGISAGKLNPHAVKFSSPNAPAKKGGDKPPHGEPTSSMSCVTTFEERCKKLGLRVSSAKV